MGRFQLTDSPAALPGCCYICGSASRKLFMDISKTEVADDPIGLDVNFTGTVYICVDECLREMVNQLDWYTPDQTQELKRKLTEANALIDLQSAVMREQGEVINGLRNADKLLSDPSSYFQSVHDSSPDSATEESSKDVSGGTEELGESEDGPAESDSDEALAGLRSAPKLDLGTGL